MDIPEQTNHSWFATFPPASAKIKEVAEWLSNLSKIAAIISALIGGLCVWLYLIRVGATFPIPDSSLALFLISFTIALTLVTLTLLVLFFLPIGAKFCAEPAARLRFESLFTENLRTKSSIWNFFNEYVRLHLPSITFSSIILILPAPQQIDLPIYTGSWAVGFAISTIWEIFNDKSAGKLWKNDLLSTLKFKFIVNSAFQMWILSLTGIFLRPLFNSLPNDMGNNNYAASLFVFLAIFLPHMLLTWGKPSIRRIALIGALGTMFLTVFCPGASMLASAALQALGFGGGLPVTLTVKRYLEDTPSAVVKNISGCLILQTGSTVILKLQDQDANLCRLQPKWFEPLQPAPRFQEIVQFQRSDVMEIGAFRAIPPPPGTH